MHTTLPCARVTQQLPRVSVTMSWGGPKPVGEYRLYVKRVGDIEEFAYYPAIEVKGGEAIFQLDDLLFVKGTGRYEGRLVVNTVTYATVQIEYRATNTLVSVENPNV
ncbi:MAG: hypothetical protein V4649_19590 [Bacteroidota bacterium]